MIVILTHEQADLDALASQLGAWLLHPGALPVLPRNINRNGRRFLSQFGGDLPYVKFNDLPREPVEKVILVDTQSLITIKGMSEDTRVVVYDHHPRREGLDPTWELNLVETGANTSQMVSRIREAGITLTPIQATALALGLYEDTGSFSYGSTTAKDLLAASFCISQGADIDLIRQFLYPPLTQDQNKLFDRLLKNIDTFQIEDKTILTAKADAMDIQDEISSVAHKMRDVLNPDALLLLVSTAHGIRLVARSTSDRVDVSAIAEAMGGGGHKRAASALIRSEPSLAENEVQQYLDEQYQMMIEDLDKYVSPIITVEGLMSKDPLILTPDTPVQEAHRLMQRYGYEGYPVVSEGKVVGLLNRREVDRSINHGLALTVESLMAAGDVKIASTASIDELQSLMGTTGWGQVPVISPDTGEIIGIVTRTDLLKTLTPHPEIPSQEEVAQKLQRAVPSERLALLHTLAEEADKINLPIFVVGGFVRDVLLDRPSLDFDIVVEGDAIFFAYRLAERFGGKIMTHRRFGTAKWHIEAIREQLIEKLSLSDLRDILPDRLPKSLDLITARTEFYEQPAALPTIESSSIKMDLHRRDFTINTLALRLDGEHYGVIQDYWGGLNDLHQGLIRVLHALSFVDDATRLLRAVRFEQRFNFQIEPRTLALLKESLPLLNKLTGARIRHEINLILAEPQAPEMLARLARLNILEAIHPSLPWNESLRQALNQLDVNKIDPVWELPTQLDNLSLKQVLCYLIWLGHLPTATLQSIASRLRFKSDLKTLMIETSQLNKALPELANAPPSQVVQMLEKISPTAIYASYLVNPGEKLRNPLRGYVQKWSSIEPHTSGDDLRAMGLPPSPAYGRILKTLRNAWLDEKIASFEEEQELLNALISETE